MTTETKSEQIVSGEALYSYLPHRPPILMLEKVMRLSPGDSGVGYKNFRESDPCFEGHFPGRAILPGVLVIEAFAQTAMVIMAAVHQDTVMAGAPIGYLAKVNDMGFYEPIYPGQEIAFEVTISRKVGRFAIAECRATRDGVKCVKGNLTLAL